MNATDVLVAGAIVVTVLLGGFIVWDHLVPASWKDRNPWKDDER